MALTLPVETQELMALLPHRPPFLFVDRVTQLDPFKSIVAERRLRAEEPHFGGHFPGQPIMPGVLISEALAQTSGLLIGLSRRAEGTEAGVPGGIFLLAAVSMKYTQRSVPGDLLVLRASAGNNLGGLFRFDVEAAVGEQVIASGWLALAEVKGG